MDLIKQKRREYRIKYGGRAPVPVTTPGDAAQYELDRKHIGEDCHDDGYETDTLQSRQKDNGASVSGVSVHHDNGGGGLRRRDLDEESDFPSEPEHSYYSPHERTLSGTESNTSWVRPESPTSFWDDNSSFSEVSTPAASDTNEDDPIRLNDPLPRRMAY